MKIKNNKLSYRTMGILFGLSLVFLLSNCSKDHASTNAAQSGLAGKTNGQTLSIDYHVVWSSVVDSNTARINRALSSPTNTRVILDYRSGGWTCDTIFMHHRDKTLWIAGSGSNPGHLIAETGGNITNNSGANFIKMLAPGCIVNGYSNGVDSTQGRATVEMFKSAYSTPSTRDAIRPGVDSAVVEGVIIKNAGEDGVYMASGHNITIKDVIVDAANRNGLTIVKGSNTTVSNCVFKNSSGASPQCGMDLEPNNPTDSLNNIIINSCVFANNAGTNLVVSQKNYFSAGALCPTTVYFYSCIIAGGSLHGIEIADLKATGPSTGQVYFQRCQVNYPAFSGVYIHDWCTGRTRINFNQIRIYNAGASVNTSPPIYIDSDTSSHYNIGNIHFQGATNRIDDFNSAHPYIVGGIAGTQAFDSIMEDSGGVLTVQRHFTSTSNPILSFTPHTGYTNTNLTLTYTLEAWP